MSRKRKPRRRTGNRTDRSSGVRQNKQLSFDQLEARHLLATFVVNSTADTVDSADGVVTLREAITSANDTAGADAITFDSSVFSSEQTIDLVSQLPDVTDDVTITGPGADLLTIDAGNGTDGQFNTNDGFRIVNIDDGDDSNEIDVELSGLTLTGGDAATSAGAIFNNENLIVTDSTITGNAGFGGGGINSGGYAQDDSTLTIIRSTISGNDASYGGGVYNVGTVTLADSTISDNTTFGDGAGLANFNTTTVTNSTISNNTSSNGVGGGFVNFSFPDEAAPTLTITNSTISGNSADFGGGISNFYGDNLTVISSTVTGNTSTDGRGGGIDNASYNEFTLVNSIVANSVGGDIGGGASDEGRVFAGSFNLIGDALAEDLDGPVLDQLTDTVIGDPLLGPLADNGGPTQTHALLPGSPAIDAGDSSVAETEDQRGLARNVNGVDIGAFEAQPAGALSVTSFARDGGGAIETLDRPDLLNQIAVEFSADVSISADDLVIRNDTLGGSLVDTSGLSFSYDASTQTATWDFSSLTLDAAFYSFELSSDIASADGSSSLDGDGAGGAFIEPVYVAIPGDANLDGEVDVIDDAFALVAGLGTTSGAAWAQGDFNGDGEVDVINDAFILVANLGTSVVSPAASAAIASPSVTSTAVVVEQAEDEDEVVVAEPSVASNATSPELSGDQVRDDAFASDFGSLDSFWV